MPLLYVAYVTWLQWCKCWVNLMYWYFLFILLHSYLKCSSYCSFNSVTSVSGIFFHDWFLKINSPLCLEFLSVWKEEMSFNVMVLCKVLAVQILVYCRLWLWHHIVSMSANTILISTTILYGCPAAIFMVSKMGLAYSSETLLVICQTGGVVTTV